jgi:hypothetical protein
MQAPVEAMPDQAFDPHATPWEEDDRTRSNPTLVTALIQEAVPATRYVGFTVTKTGRDHAAGVLPLNEASTNRHGTHQAAVIALAADHTAGVALGSLLTGVPVVGIHPQRDDNGAAIWLVRAQLEYKAPSAADLTIRATVPEEAAARVRTLHATGAAGSPCPVGR